jgi:cohesin complex subunit SCC1
LGDEATAKQSQSGWSARTEKMRQTFQEHFEQADALSFDDLTQGQTRRQAACALFEVLVLKSKGLIGVNQRKPFGDIVLTATDAL